MDTLDQKLDDVATDLDGLKHLLGIAWDASLDDMLREGPIEKEVEAKIIVLFEAVKDRLARITATVEQLAKQEKDKRHDAEDRAQARPIIANRIVRRPRKWSSKANRKRLRHA